MILHFPLSASSCPRTKCAPLHLSFRLMLHSDSSSGKPGKLRQPIADRFPWSFGADEDVKGWTNTRIIDEDTQADMSEFAIAHDRKQPRVTMPAKVDHVVFVFAKFGDALLTARQLKLFLANASERAEG
jgi:hypothetical protein